LSRYRVIPYILRRVKIELFRLLPLRYKQVSATPEIVAAGAKGVPQPNGGAKPTTDPKEVIDVTGDKAKVSAHPPSSTYTHAHAHAHAQKP
jgi:hypothetical protein